MEVTTREPVYVLTFHDGGALLDVAGVFADFAGAELAAVDGFGALYFRPRSDELAGQTCRWEATAYRPGERFRSCRDAWCRIQLTPVGGPTGLAAVLIAERYGR